MLNQPAMKAPLAAGLACAALAAWAPSQAFPQEVRAVASGEDEWDVHAGIELVIDPALSKELGRLADRQKTETVRCLKGTRQDGRILIERAEEPHIIAATPGNVRYQPCQPDTIALWHTHPALPGLRPEHLCYLSATDIVTALGRRAPPVQIVQVRSKVLCWWTPAEIRAAQGFPVLLSRPERRTGKSIDQSAVECTGVAKLLPVCVAREASRAAGATAPASAGSVVGLAFRPDH